MSALDFTARALALRATLDVRDGGSVMLNGASADGVTDDRAALNAFIANGGHVHFPAADYKTSGSVNVPSDTRIDFAKGARLMPAGANPTMILVQGSAPSAWVALSSNLAAGRRPGRTPLTPTRWGTGSSSAPTRSCPASTLQAARSRACARS